MHWIDWLIVAIPLVVVFFIAIKAQKYVKGVADFLTAGRVAGRYVVAVAGAEAGMGLISLVAIFEVYYNSGFAYSFWQAIAMPLGMIMTLSGYCIYRYRETRAMTMGQFLEMRYSRSFRIMAAALQSISGVLNYAIFPAVSARFLIYFCDLPMQVQMWGMTFPTFGLVMAIFLSIAVIIISMGGQITIMVTDCVQGILSYPLYAIIVIFLLLKLSWTQDMIPTLMERAPGESMLNPFDISKLRTFNLFYIFVGIFGSVFNRMSWSGTQGYNAAALNAHEQKMGAVMGTWRAGFSAMMILLLAISGYTFLNNAKFAHEADICRQELASRVVEDVVPDADGIEFKQEIYGYIAGNETEDIKARLSEPIPEGAKEPLRDSVRQIIASKDKSAAQSFGTIFNQMRVPLALKHLLPVGVMGVFCALCIFLLISTDTTYMHSWGSIIVQDLILPIRGKPLTPHQQLRLLRIVIAGVAVFAFLFSFFFAQIDFIVMFFAITGAIWIGGSGPVIVGGLYWKRGTTAGAYSALIAGSSIATGGIIIQKMWAAHVYPWLVSHGNIEGFTKVMESLSRPFEPYIMWRVTPDQFPINSQEIYFFTIIISISLYIIVSLLTCGEPFTMDRMLHRGKYRREGKEVDDHKKKSVKTMLLKLVGIDSQYTKGDKVLAWSVFVWSIGIGFGSFVITIIWNAIYPWPITWWGYKFTIFGLIIPCIVGIISTFWFTIGGTIDLRKMFKRLDEKEANLLDDGRVIGHVSADDVALVEEIEHVTIEEAHIEEHELEDALEKEGDAEDLEKLKQQLGEDE